MAFLYTTNQSFKIKDKMKRFTDTIVPQLTNLFYNFGKDGHVCVYVQKMTEAGFSHNAEFVNKIKVLLNISVCEPDYSQKRS